MRIQSQIYFGMIGTGINQTSKETITDRLRILTSLSYICHFYTITSMKVQLNLITELLTRYISNDFNQIPLKEGTHFIDHSSTWDSIVESFNKYEKITVDRVFFMSRTYNLLFSKQLPDSILELIGKKYGKYKYTVFIRENSSVDKLGIWLRKIKLLLPLSVVMFSHFTYLSVSEVNRILFKESHQMLLELINNRTLTYKEKYQILHELTVKFNLIEE
jgi:hypothetical protein